EGADTGQVQRMSLVEDVELHFLLQAVAGHIGVDLLGHGFDSGFHLGLVRQFGEHVDGVAHQQRRFGRVEDDDRLALGGTADHLDGAGGGFGEFIDVGTGAGAGGLAGDGGDDFRVVDVGHGGHGRDHRDGGLAAAGDHVDVRGVEVFVQVHHRHAVGADGGRGQVNDAQARFRCAQQCVVVDVGPGGGGIEDDVDAGEFGHGNQALDAGGAGGHTQ